MARIMLFIDGTWLYKNKARFAESCGKTDFQLHFGLLPQILAKEVGKQLGPTQVEIVRSYLFGSYPSNYDLTDDDAVRRQLDFYDMLREQYHYEVEIFPINFHGRRLRSKDRDPQDTFKPNEKCVDVALATLMLYLATLPGVYDIAIVVVGDLDYKPVFQQVRRLGKRVAIASIRAVCTPEFSDVHDVARVKDFDIIWLDDLLSVLELKFESHQLECQSPTHEGSRKVWTMFYPRKGQKFYCDACREVFEKTKQEAQQGFIDAQAEGVPSDGVPGGRIGQPMTGTIHKVVSNHGFGFILGSDKKEYFFHFTDLQTDLDFAEAQENLEVDFEIKKEPQSGKAGAAQNVRRHPILT